MKHILTTTAALFSFLPLLFAADAPSSTAVPASPAPRLIPGEVRRDVPITRFRGELVSVDQAHRTGSFRRVNDGELATFSVLPFASLIQHAAPADLGDYRIGQRLAFYMCEDAAGQPTLLMTATDELQELLTHQEYYFVEKIDAATGLLTCNRMPADKSKIVWENLMLKTTPETRYWKAGQPTATLADLKPGMPIRAKTYGGKGILERFACDLLLDDETLLQWQADQVKAHEQRLRDDGIPGYVDAVKGGELSVTTFPEATEYIARKNGLPAKAKVRIATAGPDRRPTGEFLTGTVTSQKTAIIKGQYIGQVTLTLDKAGNTFKPTDLVRVRVDGK